MKVSALLSLSAVAGACVLAGQFSQSAADATLDRSANTAPPPPGGGIPDVICSRIGLAAFGDNDDFQYYGEHDGIRAFAMASTSCNIGDGTAEWMDGVGGRNPVIAQNMYRYQFGRFEHIGMSWLKHSFCAVSEDTCGDCQATNCDTLGVGCADTYTSSLNAFQGNLGPRWEINPQGSGPGGVHDDDYESPQGNVDIRGRLQIKAGDILLGGRHFAEIQYVTHDEPASYRNNNASWREVNLDFDSITGVGVGQDSVHAGEPAIMAWQHIDPEVVITPFDQTAGRGRYHLGQRVYDNGNGTWTYEYALHNLNGDRAAASFVVPVADNAKVTSIQFHDVDYHSGDGIDGETIDGTDWPAIHQDGQLSWATTPYAENPNANALRWGSLYNFRFTTDLPPTDGEITVGFFRPGNPEAAVVPALVPQGSAACAADLSADGIVDTNDLLALLGQWGECSGCAADLSQDGIVDAVDLLALLGAWGDCS